MVLMKPHQKKSSFEYPAQWNHTMIQRGRKQVRGKRKVPFPQVTCPFPQIQGLPLDSQPLIQLHSLLFNMYFKYCFLNIIA